MTDDAAIHFKLDTLLERQNEIKENVAKLQESAEKQGNSIVALQLTAVTKESCAECRDARREEMSLMEQSQAKEIKEVKDSGLTWRFWLTVVAITLGSSLLGSGLTGELAHALLTRFGVTGG